MKTLRSPAQPYSIAGNNSSSSISRLLSTPCLHPPQPRACTHGPPLTPPSAPTLTQHRRHTHSSTPPLTDPRAPHILQPQPQPLHLPLSSPLLSGTTALAGVARMRQATSVGARGLEGCCHISVHPRRSRCACNPFTLRKPVFPVPAQSLQNTQCGTFAECISVSKRWCFTSKTRSSTSSL